MPAEVAAAGIGAIGSIGSAAIGSSAAGRAGQLQLEASQRAGEGVGAQYEQTRADIAPWRTGGQAAQEQYAGFLSGQGDFGAALAMNPQYQFLQQEGQRGIERSAASQGMFQSGNTMAALQERGQNLAYGMSSDYLNRLAQQSGMGLGAAGQTGQFGANAAQLQGNYGMMGAGAQAQGIMGQAGAWGQGLQDVAGFAGYAMNPQVNPTAQRLPLPTSAYTGTVGP